VDVLDRSPQMDDERASGPKSSVERDEGQELDDNLFDLKMRCNYEYFNRYDGMRNLKC
jgi:hypothetical protein